MKLEPSPDIQLLACQRPGRRITTFEVSPEKASIARETFRLAQVESWVNLVIGDARNFIERFPSIAFCFLDAKKRFMLNEKIVPRLVKGDLLVVDNALTRRETLVPMLEPVLADERVITLIVPIGEGELVCRKL